MTRALSSNIHGAAAAEMALVLPILLALIFGALEVGNYFRSEHVLIKGVRDGAVYAARQEISNYDCSTPNPTVPATVVNNSKALVRTGQLSGGADRLPLWADGSTSFTIDAACVTTAGGTTLLGIYQVNGGQVPVITVTADLPYQSVVGILGFATTGFRVRAAQQAVVIGA
jgi:Flp pilus assembly protein TadG